MSFSILTEGDAGFWKLDAGYSSPWVTACQRSRPRPVTTGPPVWATLAGVALFGDLPDGATLLGAAVIVGSGLYVVHRERVRSGRR